MDKSNQTVISNLTEEQRAYLLDRGFEIIRRRPSSEDVHPYFTFGSLDEKEERYQGVNYQEHDNSSAFFRHVETMHPSRAHDEFIVVGVEFLAASHPMKIPEGKPIRAFIMEEGVWDGVAKLLQEKYPIKR